MARKKHSIGQIVRLLREAEVELAKGLDVALVCKKLGITKQTYYRWRKEYGGLQMDPARRVKELEAENGRLKRIVAEKEVDIQILREALRGN